MINMQRTMSLTTGTHRNVDGSHWCTLNRIGMLGIRKELRNEIEMMWKRDYGNIFTDGQNGNYLLYMII